MANWAVDPLDLLQFTRLVIDALEAVQVEYALGGALAVAAWAEARSTQDVDLVINLPVEQMARFSEELTRREVLIPADLMLDQFLEMRGDVALVGYHLQWTYKVEMFLLRPGDALRASALARRRWMDLGPPLGRLAVLAAEDLILYKLAYFSLSQQQKHVRDITAICLAQSANLDQVYLNQWVSQLGLEAVWRFMQAQVRARQG
jgi:hypothetical protein